jgi:murein hydrolase activator
VLVSAAFLWLGAPQQRSPARELPPPSTPEGDAGQPAAGSFWWWGTREDRLERAGRAVERQTALAHERKSRAAHDEARARRRLRETVVRHLASAQALLRLDEAKAALADGQAALARRLNAATAMLRRQAWEGSAGQQDSARARLLAAEVLRAGVEARLRELRLAAERDGRARELRSLAAEVALRRVELDRAAARRHDREAAWRAAELAREERNRRRAAVAREMSDLAGALAAADALALPSPVARRPDGASGPPVRVHKRGIPLERRLDRRWLRLLGEPFGPRPAGRRRLDPGPSAADPGTHALVVARGGGRLRGAPALWPIAGAPRGPDPSVPGLRKAGFTILSAVPQTVSAPTAGTVAFAGPFRGFGLLLIIDRGGGYHALLAGFSRLDVRRGASVVAGQAVGEIAAQGNEPARLYLELRYRGSPIDPAPWLAAHEDKVRG